MLPPSTRERFLPISDPLLSPLRRLGVSLAGQSDVRPGYLIVRHAHRHHAVIYNLEGKARYACASGEGVMNAGERLIFPAHELQAYEPIGLGWKMIWFHFDARESDRRLAGGFGKVSAVNAAATLRQIAGGFLDEWQQRRQIGMLSLWAGLLTRFLRRDLLSKTTITAPGGESALRLDEVWQIAEKELGKDWDLEKLASHTIWTKAHFARLCLERYGEAPMKRLTRLRMEYGQGLLAGTSLKISEIAERLGYQNEFAFSTAFSRWVGVAPSLWRGKTRERLGRAYRDLKKSDKAT